MHALPEHAPRTPGPPGDRRRAGGYLTAQQAGSIGYDRRHLAYHVAAGNLERVGWGLYRLPGLPCSEYDDLIRWTLWSRDRQGHPQAVVGHESALAVHGLGDVLPSDVHLIVPRTFRKRAPTGCRLHRGEVVGGDVEEREGFGVTNPTRTLLDLASRPGFSTHALRLAAKEAMEQGKVRASDLRFRAERRKLAGRLGLSREGSRHKKP